MITILVFTLLYHLTPRNLSFSATYLPKKIKGMQYDILKFEIYPRQCEDVHSIDIVHIDDSLILIFRSNVCQISVYIGVEHFIHCVSIASISF